MKEAGVPLAKAGQILKLLNKYSSTKAGYEKKMGAYHDPTRGDGAESGDGGGRGSDDDDDNDDDDDDDDAAEDEIKRKEQELSQKNSVAAAAALEKKDKERDDDERDDDGDDDERDDGGVYLGKKQAPLLKMKLKSKSGQDVALSMRCLMPGDTLENATTRVEHALKKAMGPGPVDPKKVKSVRKALYAQSKKKTKWNEEKATLEAKEEKRKKAQEEDEEFERQAEIDRQVVEAERLAAKEKADRRKLPLNPGEDEKGYVQGVKRVKKIFESLFWTNNYCF